MKPAELLTRARPHLADFDSGDLPDLRTEIEAASSAHRWRGAAKDGDPPALVFALQDASGVDAWTTCPTDDVRVMIWTWDHGVAGCFTATLVRPGGEGPCCTLELSSSPFLSLERGRLLAVLTWRGRVVRAWKCDYTRSPDAQGHLFEMMKLAHAHTPILPGHSAGYWIGHESRTRGLQALGPTVDEGLQLGWASSVGVVASYLGRQDMSSDATRSAAIAIQSASDGLVQGENSYFPLLKEYAQRGFKPASCIEFLEAIAASADEATYTRVLSPTRAYEAVWDEVVAEAGPESPTLNVLQFALGMRDLLFLSPSLTADGTQVPYLSLNKTIESIRVRPDGFPTQFDVKRFWPAVIEGNLKFWPTLGDVFGATDVPVDKDASDGIWDRLPATDVPEAALASAEELLGEAAGGKRWSIPWGAFVQIPLGPFVGVRLYEESGGQYVSFALETVKGESWPGLLNVETASVHWLNALHFVPGESISQPEWDREASVVAAVTLLVAAVVRDFWVVEDRSRVFEVRIRSDSVHPRLKQRKPRTRIVYLPRIKYSDETREGDLAQLREALSHGERRRTRQHGVRMHLRKCENPSERQKFLAAAYGILLDEGYTFVGPHQRGDDEGTTIYRSRSALQCIYGAETASAAEAEPDSWFRFEKAAKAHLESKGFAVEHMAPNKGADGGVDLYATKGTGLEALQYVVQAKHSKKGKKVGPAVVREIVGVLASYPRSTRGLIVTNVGFTPKAVEFAVEHGVQLMSGLRI